MLSSPLHKCSTPAPLALAAALAMALVAGLAPLAHAQAEAGAAGAPVVINIAAQPLGQALNELARQANLQMTFAAALVAGKQAPPVTGNLTVRQALDRLLAGSGLIARFDGSSVIVQAALSGSTQDEPTLPAVRVTASSEPLPGEPPKPYAGGQVARGGRVGILGNKDFLQTPFSQNSYTELLVRNQQAKTVADVLGNDASVRSSESRFGLDEGFVIRGFGLFAQDIAFDGLFGLTNTRQPAIEGIERVEVLRGPSALLYGLPAGGNVGGTINLVPKRADDAPLNRLTARYQSDSTYGAVADVGRRFGPDNAIGLRANLAHDEGASPVQNQEDRRDVATLAFDYRGEKARLSYDFTYQDKEQQAPFFAPFALPGFQIPAVPRTDRNFHQPWERFASESTLNLLKGEYDLADAATVFASYGRSRSDHTFGVSLPTILNAGGDLEQQAFVLRQLIENETVEAGLRTKFNTGPVGHALILAATELRIESSSSDARNIGPLIRSNLYRPVFVPEPEPFTTKEPVLPFGRTTLTGLALADSLSMLEDRLQLTVGLRLQEVKVERVDRMTGVTRTPYDKRKTSPGIAALYRLTPSVSVYANYIEGLTQGPTAPAGTSNAGDVFPPTVSEQYEAGAKFDFGAVGGGIAVFQTSQPSGFTDPTTTVFGVDGEQRHRGIEFTAFGAPAAGLRTLAGLTLLDAELTKSAGGTFDGNRAPGAPRAQLNVSGEYDLAFAPGLTATAKLVATSRQEVDRANTQSIPGWSRLDLGARYSFKPDGRPLTARLDVLNVLGKDYWNGAGNDALSVGTTRTFLFSVSGDF